MCDAGTGVHSPACFLIATRRSRSSAGVMAYASRTGTRRNLDLLRRLGWGLMVSAAGRHRTEGFTSWALDNGAWTAFAQKQPWNEQPFLELVEQLGHGADFIVAPDIVAGGLASLRLSEAWLPRLVAA